MTGGQVKKVEADANWPGARIDNLCVKATEGGEESRRIRRRPSERSAW